MLIFSINFALYFLLLCGKVHQALRSDELRFFLAVVAFSTLLISINIWPMYPADGSAVRHAAFQVGSIISTTGFASTDFNLWPEFSRILLVLLMFIGACAGSTGGAIKCSRAPAQVHPPGDPAGGAPPLRQRGQAGRPGGR